MKPPVEILNFLQGETNLYFGVLLLRVISLVPGLDRQKKEYGSNVSYLSSEKGVLPLAWLTG